MIQLYTAATPNGWKISVLLEELGVDYKLHAVDFSSNQQKSEAYTALNPNGRIPTIVDPENDDFVVFESGAIMLYLAEKYGMFIPKDRNGRSRVTQWLMFQMSGIGPMMGQANVFYRYFPEKIPAVIDRYHNEVKRLFSVLDKQLAHNEYLAGDYSIADIANWCWVHIHEWSGVELEPYKNLSLWVNKIAIRPAVIKGINIPEKISREEIKKAGAKLIKS
ncbi:MAG: glutathione S-transferase N-terminal domain-containing protein [Proteobacteria bacterium]|nr:glutathione S-transferase N-terminal domain-containing protein [Pseudomonadota bacterium]